MRKVFAPMTEEVTVGGQD